jgi:hypothetical protein
MFNISATEICGKAPAETATMILTLSLSLEPGSWLPFDCAFMDASFLGQVG